MAMQHTKIAATTNRYTVAKALEKFASMIWAGPQNPPMASLKSGIAISVAHRKMAPMTKAPITEPSTALGASLRGSFVSSARVDAVSNP